ncbi:hypothetical protein TRFO_37945 [Tritrichomonas foetus]|uniref:Uncharacterized protein n=1 Tax=Tritrichomonas foetus TaxID=1144522 RepID=A0A1J4J9V8_9EUKA|nr:hypothetical protein TRFO_37945 [Tritrichomonas foetus]|eukprot:OHS95944.1 hypothetical protein TRFO_37945 [Tritrichomonas foetus]
MLINFFSIKFSICLRKIESIFKILDVYSRSHMSSEESVSISFSSLDYKIEGGHLKIANKQCADLLKKYKIKFQTQYKVAVNLKKDSALIKNGTQQIYCDLLNDLLNSNETINSFEKNLKNTENRETKNRTKCCFNPVKINSVFSSLPFPEPLETEKLRELSNSLSGRSKASYEHGNTSESFSPSKDDESNNSSDSNNSSESNNSESFHSYDYSSDLDAYSFLQKKTESVSLGIGSQFDKHKQSKKTIKPNIPTIAPIMSLVDNLNPTNDHSQVSSNPEKKICPTQQEMNTTKPSLYMNSYIPNNMANYMNGFNSYNLNNSNFSNFGFDAGMNQIPVYSNMGTAYNPTFNHASNFNSFKSGQLNSTSQLKIELPKRVPLEISIDIKVAKTSSNSIDPIDNARKIAPFNIQHAKPARSVHFESELSSDDSVATEPEEIPAQLNGTALNIQKIQTQSEVSQKTISEEKSESKIDSSFKITGNQNRIRRLKKSIADILGLAPNIDFQKIVFIS